MLAALAVEAADAWRDPMVSTVARAVIQMEGHMPDEWREEWLTHQPVASAHQVDFESHAEEESELEQHIDDALKSAGLAGTEMILSPAQRQARGLVRRHPSRVRRILRTVGVAAAVVFLSAGTALAVNTFVAEDPILPVAAPPPSTAPATTIPRLEDTIIARPPDTGVFGVAAYRGGNERTGVTDGGFRTVLGKYWDLRLAGSIETDPVAYGSVLYLGMANPDRVLHIFLDNGLMLQASVETGGRVRSTPVFDPVGGTPYLVFGTDDGRVYATNTLRDEAYWNPPKNVEGAVSAAPLLFGSTVVVVTEDGVVRSLSIEEIGTGLGVGESSEEESISWTYTGTESVPLGPVNSSPASDGTDIYVVDENGWIHIIDLASGSPSCEPIQANGHLARGSNPIVSGDFVYLPTTEGNLDRLELGSCVLRDLLVVGPSIFDLAPVIHENVMYAVEGPWLQAFDVPPEALNAATLWEAPFTAEGQDPITTAPVLAEGVLYVGTQGGMVYAVDASDGTELWRFDAGATIVGSPAVLGNAVIVTTESNVIAIAGE
jgi:outer membrane protein assembly factor BamB